MTEKFIKLPEVKNLTGLSRSSIYSFVKLNTFPAPIRLSQRSVAWIESEVGEWIESRIKATKQNNTRKNLTSKTSEEKSVGGHHG